MEAVLEESTEDRVVRVLDRAMTRDLRKEECGRGGMRSAREVAQTLGLDKKVVRVALAQAAEAGRIRREEFSNALLWRSKQPLPWEPGGAMHAQWQADAEAAKAPKVLIVQACSAGGSRDVATYPLAWRDRAEDRVSLGNSQSRAW